MGRKVITKYVKTNNDLYQKAKRAEMIQTCFKRIEKKYLLNRAQYYAMLRGIENYMEPDEYFNYQIGNIYYDTDHFDLVRTSLEKPIYKEKLRVRSYGIPRSEDIVFVELKKKFDGIVYKRRIIMSAEEASESLSRGQINRTDQISREINWFLYTYNPHAMAYIGYDREAFAGIENPDLRMTFDTNLRGRSWDTDLRAGDHGMYIIPKDTILMEIKIPGSAPLWLSHLLSEYNIFDSSFSKYGTYYKQMIGTAPICLESYKGEYIYA